MTLAVDDYGNMLQSVAIGYGRRHAELEAGLSEEDREKQRRTHISYSENRYTNPILQNDDYRTPLPCESRTYEVLKARPSANLPLVTNLFRFDEVLRLVAAASDGTHDIPYEDTYATLAIDEHPYRRLIEHVRSLFRRDDLTGPLPLSQLEPLALPFESYKLAFTPGLLTDVYGERITEAMLETEGHYVHSEGDANWWTPSGRVFFSPGSADTPAQELAHARQHFLLPHRYRNPFHTSEVSTESFVSYDAYDLLILETLDALGNRLTVGERDTDGNLTKPGNDYRVLQPKLIMDPNRNRTEVAFDALGMVVGTSVMGKPEENLGDSLDGFEADLTDAVILSHLSNPLADPHSILNRASTRLVYDLFAYQRTKNEPEPQSAVVYTLARETHDANLVPGQKTKIQHSFSYSGGFGREIQEKIQAEPGKVDGNLTQSRWVGSGWTIFNNKEKPVRQYEPFFSNTHRYEFAKQQGVSPILFYDPIERVVATLHPNHTWEKMVFDPWRQESWDVNDTVLLDPDVDIDVQGFFRSLPKADYLPTWYQERINKPLGDLERQAAEKTSHHANTPKLAYFDTLGRPFLSIADNGPAGKYATRTELDIEGNQRAVIDAKNRIVMRYDYDMLGTRIHQASMEAGERWMLNDVAGEPIRACNSRGHAFRTEYDPLRRLLQSFVVGADAKDPSQEILYERTIYGETQAEAYNHWGRVFQVFDCAGVVTSEAYDFKGNLLRSTRQLVHDYKSAPDWAQQSALEDEIFTSHTVYDALNRPITLTAPDKSVIQPTYNEANLLDNLKVNLRGAETATPFVANIDYNSKGQRERINYGNGTRTDYAYDEKTFRLIELRTLRGTTALQDLSYTYDPAGNITHIRDDAQQTIFFRNRRVEPSTDYVYDAIYRLIQATGRERLGQSSNGCPFGPVPTSHSDQPRVGLLHPGDGHAMGIYQESYEYDEVGNFLRLLHQGIDPLHAGWKREYQYHEPSLLDPAQNSNRLSSTRVGEATETYAYDIHGNMLQMPHLAEMVWDFKDQLQALDLGGGGRAYHVYDVSGQRVRKVHEHSGSTIEERIYLGDFEIYRKRTSGEIKLERETLPLMDHQLRLALIETRSLGNGPSPAQLIRYQLGNNIGTATLELDSEARVISFEEYYPYGGTSYQGVRSQTETPKRYRYSGKERDEESGFYYHGARYYSPWLGRWLSIDPLLLIGKNSAIKQSELINPYLYVENRPVVAFDPDGTLGTLATAGIGLLVGAVVGTVVEGGRQLYTKGTIDNPRAVLAAAAGGAVAGGLAGLTLGASFVAGSTVATGAAVATTGSIAGGATTRAITGEQQTSEAVARDAVVGLLTFGVIKGGSSAIGSIRSAITSQSARTAEQQLVSQASQQTERQVVNQEIQQTAQQGTQLEVQQAAQQAAQQDTRQASTQVAANALSDLDIVVVGNVAKPGNFILRPGVDIRPIGNVTIPGKSGSLATSLTLEGEIEQMFRRAPVRGDTIAGGFVQDIRAAGFDAIRAPTEANPLHVRIIAGENTFDETGREWLSLAFDRLARAKK